MELRYIEVIHLISNILRIAFFEVGKIIGEDELTQQSNPSFTTSLIRAASYIREFCETSLSSTKVVSFQ